MSNTLNPIGEPWKPGEKSEFERVAKIIAPVPFVSDWVEYKGKTVFAIVDTEKSSKCGRPIIGIGYCATAVIVNNRIDSTHNYSPETFRWCRLSSESWEPKQ